MRKVYSIVGVQLLLTTAVTAVPLSSKPAQDWMSTNYGVLIAAMVILIVVNCAMICFMKLARTVPINYALLLIFTLCEAYCVACCTIGIEPKYVLAAAGTTTAIVLAVTVFAWFTKSDFTIMGPMFVVLGMTLCMFGLMCFFIHNSVVYNVYCALIVIIFGFYLIFDT